MQNLNAADGIIMYKDGSIRVAVSKLNKTGRDILLVILPMVVISVPLMITVSFVCVMRMR